MTVNVGSEAHGVVEPEGPILKEDNRRAERCSDDAQCEGLLVDIYLPRNEFAYERGGKKWIEFILLLLLLCCLRRACGVGMRQKE